jgi:hypothetical protein
MNIKKHAKINKEDNSFFLGAGKRIEPFYPRIWGLLSF